MATPDAVTDAPPEESSPKQRQRAGSYSGRLLLRMPRSLHEELARASDRDGVSLNQFITGVLASAVDWRRDDGAASGATSSGRRPRGMALLLMVNLVLVGLAAAAAIGFLIAAWLS
jgi:RNA polymerase sigma-B factor